MTRLLAIVLSTFVMLSACASTGGSAEAGKPLVLIIGATGGTGQEAVAQALAKGYAVRALVRDEAKARTLFGDRVQYAVGDVREPRTLRPAMRGVDYVLSALGSNSARDPENKPELVDYGGVKSLAEAAKDAGVQHFVLTSSMGVTNPDHQLNRILDKLLTWKLKGEDALRASGVNYTIVRPGGLNNDPGGRAGIEVMQGDPHDVVGQIPRADVAAVLVNALGRKEAMGRTFEIIGDPEGGSVDWDRLYTGLQPDVR
ncbi:MAG TPA: SDR family oxidoreductase [Steroidobacteraceae bacterium]|nr:SDR family oxidoreductase [Steroidobacteraceae bacterium]